MKRRQFLNRSMLHHACANAEFIGHVVVERSPIQRHRVAQVAQQHVPRLNAVAWLVFRLHCPVHYRFGPSQRATVRGRRKPAAAKSG